MTEGDAGWVAKEVIMPELRELRKSIEKRDEHLWKELKEQSKCIIKMKLSAEREKGKLTTLDEKMKGFLRLLSDHLKDTDRHYNSRLAGETTAHKLWRKKPELMAEGSLAAAIVFLTSQIIQLLQR